MGRLGHSQQSSQGCCSYICKLFQPCHQSSQVSRFHRTAAILLHPFSKHTELQQWPHSYRTIRTWIHCSSYQ
uniref:Uncharacterized protein n=1 Tax=Anguilla anguilla TaxID=7936 RepID=A0A0E9XTC2_ANGAN